MAEVAEGRAVPSSRTAQEGLRAGYYAAYRIVKRVNFALLVLAAVAIVGMDLFTVWEVYTRYALKDPATWTYPIVSYLLLYTIYLATAQTLQQGGHVRVEVVVEQLPARWRAIVERLAHMLGMAFVLVFLWQGWRLAERAIQDGERDISMLAIPLSLTTIAIPIGLALMAITYVFIIVDSFLSPSGARPAEKLPEIEI